MDLVTALVDQLMDRVGDLWFLALLGSFFVMICEASKPKPAEGETRSEWQGVGLWVSILSLVTPLLLFFHGFLSGGSVIALIAVMGGAILAATLIGWLISIAARDVARTLNRAAPYLAVVVFALAAYVSWRSVFDLATFFVAR
ncbi:hypothetical protein U91I_03005 [alpha proteobacterium U9-1i]|nr:hypothetical protein U91I_03005 [alpha proteobacterium U9-1i]